MKTNHDAYRRPRVVNLAILTGACLLQMMDRGTAATEGALYGASAPGVLSEMTDMVLRSHYEAKAFGQSRTKASADDILGTVDDFREEYPLTWCATGSV